MGYIFKEGYDVTQKWANKHPFFDGKYHKNFYAKFGSPGGHNGLDLIPLTPGDTVVHTPIAMHLKHAANNYDNGYGAYVKGVFRFDGDELYIYFCHLDEWFDDILTEDLLPAGTPIGIMGGSGNGLRECFSPHLHFGVKPVSKEMQYKHKNFAGYINPSFLL